MTSEKAHIMSGVNQHISVLVGDCILSVKRIGPEYSTLKKIHLNDENAVAGYDKILALIKYDPIKENYDIFYGAAKKKLDALSGWAGTKSFIKMLAALVANDMTCQDLKAPTSGCK
jgi:hypothetical protein